MTDAANDSGNDELELELNDDDLLPLKTTTSRCTSSSGPTR